MSSRRIVIIGKTGAGKSSLANTIFGEELFKVGHTFNSFVRKCQTETKSVNGRSITLTDTPGFYDVSGSVESMNPEIVRCITACSSQPHAFLIVLKVERFTEHEQEIIKNLQQYFSEDVFKYATVVFTHGDQLPQGMTIGDCVRQNEPLSDLVRKCGGRCHVIDNRYWNEKPKDEYRSNRFQVEELLNTIDQTLVANNRSGYNNELLQTVREEIQREEENIRISKGNMSGEEIGEQAKARVFKKLLVKLRGVGAGALLGALFGVGVMVKVTVAISKQPLKSEIGTAKAEAAGGGVISGGLAGAVVGGH